MLKKSRVVLVVVPVVVVVLGTAAFLFSIFQSWAGVLLGLTVIALFRNVLFPPSLAGGRHQSLTVLPLARASRP